MQTRLACAAGLLAAVMLSGLSIADPGVQVVACYEDPMGSDDWHFSFLSCTGSFSVDEFQLMLTADEIAEGTTIIGCDVPAGVPGHACSHTATQASFTFPTIAPDQCVPDIPDVYLMISMHTTDQSTVVGELFKMNGSPVSAILTLVSCPPVPVEPTTWGAVKALYE